MLTPSMQMLLKTEIANDSEGRGYAGKTADQIALLLNTPYQVTTIQHLYVICRTSAIFDMVQSAPNAITSTEVTTAMGS